MSLIEEKIGIEIGTFDGYLCIAVGKLTFEISEEFELALIKELMTRIDRSECVENTGINDSIKELINKILSCPQRSGLEEIHLERSLEMYKMLESMSGVEK